MRYPKIDWLARVIINLYYFLTFQQIKYMNTENQSKRYFSLNVD